MVKLSVKPEPALSFFLFRFEYLISSLKSYGDFGESGRWLQVVATSFVLSGHLFMKPQKNLREQNSWRRSMR